VESELGQALSPIYVPWIDRQAFVHHEQWYRRLIGLHELTLSWLQELKIDRPSYFIDRIPSGALSEGMREMAGLLEGFAVSGQQGQPLADLLDDTSPDDLLARMERLVFVVQSATVSGILEKTEMRNVLEQAAWRSGRQYAQAAWQGTADLAGADLRQVVTAYSRSPIFPRIPKMPLLIQRALHNDVRLELRSCPHHSPYAEVMASADLLCPMHQQWTRGFAYELNARIEIESGVTRGPEPTRCTQRWSLRR
jgi:hypothetical protein